MKKTIFLSFAKFPCFLSAIAVLACAMALTTTPARAQSGLNPLYTHLPPSAGHIYSIRVGQIISKGELLNILNSIPPPKDPKSAMVMNLVKDPASTGIDLNHEILVAQTTATGAGADTLSFTQILVPLTDSAKFRTSIAAVHKEVVHRVPGKGATTSEGKQSMVWNDHLVVITMASFEFGGSTHKHFPAVHQHLRDLIVGKGLAALAGFPNNPLLSDQRFVAGFSTDEDVHAWSTRMDFGKTMSSILKKMAAKNPAMKDKPFPDYNNSPDMPHPPVMSTFNFADGKIILRTTTFHQPDDAAIFRRVADRPINKDLLAHVPAGLLLGAGAMHINMAAIPDLLDKYHTRGKLDSMLGKKGLSITDITSALGGDFMIAALGDTTAATDTTKKKLNIYFVATLGDPSKLMQLAAKASANGAATDTAQMAKMKKLLDKIVIRGNTLVISGSKEMAQKYFDSADRRPTSLLDDSKGMQTFVVDLKACGAFVQATMSNNPKAMLAARIFERLDKVRIENGVLDGDNMVLTFEIDTGDPSTNSLKTLVGLLH